MRTEILKDHTKKNGKLIPPFNSLLKDWDTQFIEVPYNKIIIPEIIWQLYLIKKYGAKEALEISKIFFKNISEASSVPYCYFSSNLDQVSDVNFEKNLSNNNCLILKDALLPYLSLIRHSFFDRLFPDIKGEKNNEDIEKLKDYLSVLYDKNSPETIMTIANIVIMVIEYGNLQLPQDSSLHELSEVYNYPNTDKSKKIAGVLRAAINPFIRPEFIPNNTNWSIQFWIQCNNIEPIKIEKLIVDHYGL